MPQLIAMIIVVVAAMIYMFQTFGGTGDKIEGVAQKTSIITEINNIKNGVQLALRNGSIVNGGVTSLGADQANDLQGIAKLQFFPEQINNQLTATGAAANIYKAISFGGDKNLQISLVLPSTTAAADKTARPGIYVDLTQGNLATNVTFLEKQVVADLKALAEIDTKATSATYKALKEDGTFSTALGAAVADDDDGKFVIYFKDLPRGMIK